MRKSHLIATALLPMTIGLASADVIYETDGPFGGPFGLWGMDIFTGQAAAQRFTPNADYRLDAVRLWIMSNDFFGVADESVKVTIQTDAGINGQSYPSGVVLDSTEIEISAIGWNPVQEEFLFEARPWLFKEVRYWVVCESEMQGGLNPVWTFAAFGSGFYAFRPWDANWQPGGEGAELTMVVEATHGPCVADLAEPIGVLDLADIQTFVQAFVAMHPAADIAAPYGTFDLADLAVFMETFLTGCP